MSDLQDKLNKMIEHLNSPEGEASISQFAKDLIEKKQQKLDFFHSERCQTILALFESSELESIHDDDYHYNNDKVSFLFNSEEESNLFFNSLIEANQSNSIVDEEADFSTTLFYINKKFVATLVCGQGSFIVLSKLKNKLVNIENIVLGEDNNESFGYTQAVFEDGSKTIQCFGNPNKIVSCLVLK